MTDEDEAAQWALRLDGEALAAGERRALDAWLLEDPRRRGALFRAEAVLAYLDRGRALAEPRSENTSPRASVVGRRGFVMGGALSGLAAVSAVSLLKLRSRPTEIGTAIGEVRRVPLADGSVASINTDSRMAFAIADGRRNVSLERGEAWFQVAHDKIRPFIVEAGKVRVQAVGTAFSVRRRDGGADVLVTEGVVDAWVEGQEDDRTRIAAGSRSFVVETGPVNRVEKAPADVDRTLAWRTGELALNGETLEYAVAEFNRYNVRKLVIGDQALAKEPLIGYFRTDQPEDFGRAVAGMVDAKVTIEGHTIRLDRRAAP